MTNRRLSYTATSIAAAVLLVLQGGAIASAQTLLRTTDINVNGIADGWAYDDDGDGLVDRLLLDANEDGTAEAVAYVNGGAISQAWFDVSLDAVFDAKIVFSAGAGGTGSSTWWLDTDQNGLWESGLYDGNNDGQFESVSVDTDSDGSADTWVASVTPRGQTAMDVVNNSQALNIVIDSARWLGNLPCCI